jgi:hypothetical protein
MENAVEMDLAIIAMHCVDLEAANIIEVNE